MGGVRDNGASRSRFPIATDQPEPPELRAPPCNEARSTMIVGRIFENTMPRSLWSDRALIQEELFSAERLEEHARSLAVAQPVTLRTIRGHPLADRLLDNSKMLLKANRALVTAV